MSSQPGRLPKPQDKLTTSVSRTSNSVQRAVTRSSTPRSKVVPTAATRASVQRKATPQPPPIYRPQAVPKVLQTKQRTGGNPVSKPVSAPTAPPAYRPQPVPKVLQRKQTSQSTTNKIGPLSAAAAPAVPPKTGSLAGALTRPSPQRSTAGPSVAQRSVAPGALRTIQRQRVNQPSAIPGKTPTHTRQHASSANHGTIQCKPFVPWPEHNYALTDIGDPSWTKEDLKQLLRSYPYQMADRYSDVINKQIRVLKYRKLHMAKGTVRLLNQIRDDYNIGNALKYVFLQENDWNIKARELKFDVPEKHNNYGGTIGGPYHKFKSTPVSYMFVGESHLRRWLEQGEIGNIVNVIEHEYIHVKQFHDPIFQQTNHPVEDMEIEAYWREIEHIAALTARGREELLPEDKSMREAVYSFIEELKTASKGAKSNYQAEEVKALKMRSLMQTKRVKPQFAILWVLDRQRCKELYLYSEMRLSKKEHEVAENALLDEETIKRRMEYTSF